MKAVRVWVCAVSAMFLFAGAGCFRTAGACAEHVSYASTHGAEQLQPVDVEYRSIPPEDGIASAALAAVGLADHDEPDPCPGRHLDGGAVDRFQNSSPTPVTDQTPIDARICRDDAGCWAGETCLIRTGDVFGTCTH